MEPRRLTVGTDLQMGRARQGSSVVDEGADGIPPPLVPVPASGKVRGGDDVREIGHARGFKRGRPARGLRAGWFGGFGFWVWGRFRAGWVVGASATICSTNACFQKFDLLLPREPTTTRPAIQSIRLIAIQLREDLQPLWAAYSFVGLGVYDGLYDWLRAG